MKKMTQEFYDLHINQVMSIVNKYYHIYKNIIERNGGYKEFESYAIYIFILSYNAYDDKHESEASFNTYLYNCISLSLLDFNIRMNKANKLYNKELDEQEFSFFYITEENQNYISYEDDIINKYNNQTSLEEFLIKEFKLYKSEIKILKEYMNIENRKEMRYKKGTVDSRVELLLRKIKYMINKDKNLKEKLEAYL